VSESSIAALAIAAINAVKDIAVAWLKQADRRAKTAAGSRRENGRPADRE
jgi:hypothetical protein